MKEEGESIRKRLFIKNGMIMAVSALVIRSLGMVFRVFLTEKLGPQGLGLYQLVLSVYIVFAAVASTGVSLCATRIFSELSAQGLYGQARFSVERCMAFAFLSGALLGAVMLAGAKAVSELVLRDGRAFSALAMLAPSLPFLGVSACVRGYFFARRKTLQTCGEQLLEQMIEMGSFITLFSIWQPEDLGQACLLTAAGTTAAEVISFVYSVVCYRADISSAHIRRERTGGLTARLLPVFMPVTANALLRSGLSAAENALVPIGLQRSGLSPADALSGYGVISGMTMPVLTFPSVLVLPFAALVIPEISEERVCGHSGSVRRITEKMISASLRYSVPVTVIFVFFGTELCEALFRSREAGMMLAMLAPAAPFMYLDSVADSILKGLDRQTSYFVFNTIDSVIRVLLTVVLLPFMGIFGVVTVIMVSELLNTLMSLMKLASVTSFRLNVAGDILLPTLCITVPCLFMNLLPDLGSAAGLAVKLTVCTLVYGGLILLLNRMKRKRQEPGAGA